MSNYQIHKAVHAKQLAIKVLRQSKDDVARLLAQALLEQTINQLQKGR